MKHYFKYSSGYLNIDAENLFLTNSGNWQETRDLNEKDKQSKRKNSLRIVRLNLFIYITFGIIAFIMYKSITRDKPIFNAIFGLPIAAYFVNRYFAIELGNRYKIPLFKIQSIGKYDSDGIKINFLNAANEPDFEIIEKVEAKGNEVLGQLGLLDAQAHS